MDPARDAAVVFGWTVYDTSPVPVPLAVLTVSHVSVVAAVHVHPACVVTVNTPPPPRAALDAEPGASV
jgi:hypothetical protein